MAASAELQRCSEDLLLLITLLCRLHSAFLTLRGWKLFDLQYVLATKER